jgi:hypothetical protein
VVEGFAVEPGGCVDAGMDGGSVVDEEPLEDGKVIEFSVVSGFGSDSP